LGLPTDLQNKKMRWEILFLETVYKKKKTVYKKTKKLTGWLQNKKKKKKKKKKPWTLQEKWLNFGFL